jgi:hypothetical protein
MVKATARHETLTPPVPQPAPDTGVRRTTGLNEAIRQDRRTTTTVQVSTVTRARLDTLQTVMNVPDINAVITRLIDVVPKKLSTEDEIHLVLPASRYRWLLVHQDKDDCRNCLNDARV